MIRRVAGVLGLFRETIAPSKRHLEHVDASFCSVGLGYPLDFHRDHGSRLRYQ